MGLISLTLEATKRNDRFPWEQKKHETVENPDEGQTLSSTSDIDRMAESSFTIQGRIFAQITQLGNAAVIGRIGGSRGLLAWKAWPIRIVDADLSTDPQRACFTPNIDFIGPIYSHTETILSE